MNKLLYLSARMYIYVLLIITFVYLGYKYLTSNFFNTYYIQCLLQYIIPRNKDAYLDKDIYFPDNSLLETNWKIIQKECEEVIRKYGSAVPDFKDIEPSQQLIIENGQWKVFVLRTLGQDQINGKDCPETMKLIRKCKGIRNAFFSISYPNTSLAPHAGPFYGVYRYHLGLIVPEPENCELVVNGIKKNWKEGEGFMFDDTHLHSASNSGTKQRVVLFLDIERNDVNPIIKIIDDCLNILLRNTPQFIDSIHRTEPFAL